MGHSGDQGKKGTGGSPGMTPYEHYVYTTKDNPVKSEEDWFEDLQLSIIKSEDRVAILNRKQRRAEAAISRSKRKGAKR